MVKEYMKLSHSFEEIKAENISLKNSSIESSSEELEDIESLKTELSKLMIENDLLRNESSELKAEVEKLTKEMSSWNQSARALHKLQESQKSVYDRTVLGFSSSESSEGETSTQSQLVYDKFNKMSFVKSNVIYDCYESITFDDLKSHKLNDNGKDRIGFQRPENSKPSWLKNKLDKDKAKAGSKSFVPNQPRRNSRKAKSGWTKAQPRRDLSGKLALQRLAAVVLRIRSTTGNMAPSSVCTRRPDEFVTNGISLSWWSEQVQPRRRRHTAAAREGGGRERRGRREGWRLLVNREASTCVTLNGSEIQLVVGSQPLRLRNHNFGLTHRIMYGPFNTYIPIRSTTIGKSRVARDPITMHTPWRSNSDITCVTRRLKDFIANGFSSKTSRNKSGERRRRQEAAAATSGGGGGGVRGGEEGRLLLMLRVRF
ncbi:hypothetical protein F511_37153 [Dorcoceras hygrometricum]|uniref:Uncharacterized protein n=1 Tax=Dorcoceras hygrometricum TaxID=472368 RepID=A0A2Z7C1S0_9LAMI|nr:hypothetical protein F511_37153 [Dorcoceras hygrometricum]